MNALHKIGGLVRAILESLNATSGPASGSSRSIRNHMVAGLVIVIVLAFGVGGWAGTVNISGAIIAPGQIVVDSNVKKVQHPTGGIVGELLVHDGDRVKAGQVLVRLDDTVTRANLAIVTKGLTELAARKARLESERDGDDSVKFPSELLQQAKTNIDYEVRKAKEAIKAEAVDIAMELAERKLKGKLTKEEQLKLLEESIAKIEGRK